MAKPGSQKTRSRKPVSKKAPARKKTASRKPSLREQAAGLSFFFGLTAPELDVVMSLCRETHGPAGEMLIEEGTPVKNLYVLLSGKLDVFKKQADGNQSFLATVGTGDVLGELSFLQSVSASATVKATQPFTALAIDQGDLQRLLVTDLNIAAKLYQKLALIASRRVSATLLKNFEVQSNL